jgi:hypothetical protein
MPLFTGYFSLIHMQTINWWLSYFHVDFLDNVVHSFIYHPFIHSFIIHPFIHALVVTIPYVQIACPTIPESPQSTRNLTNKPPTNPIIQFHNRLGFWFKVQKVRLTEGREEGRKRNTEHHSPPTHPPTHPRTHSFGSIRRCDIMCETTLISATACAWFICM